ncbi:hypothetical protein ACFL0C_01710, partial [Patescibacteria group bacterium]
MEENKDIKKRILVFIPEFPVLTETFIERDLASLVSRGNLDISILYLKRGTGHMSKEVTEVASKSRLNPIDALFSIKYYLLYTKRVLLAWSFVKRDLTKSVFQRCYLFAKAVGYTNIFASFKPNEIHAHFLSDPST